MTDDEYLSSVFKLNPVFQANEIVALRKNFLAERRENAPRPAPEWRAAYRRLRTKFWTLDDTTLQQRITALEESTTPEARFVIDRVRIVADHRPALEEMANRREIDLGVLTVFQDVFLASSDEVSDLRRDAKRTFTDEGELIAAQHGIRRLRELLPAVADLERSWFDGLLKVHEATVAFDTPRPERTSETELNFVNLLPWLLMAGVVWIIRWLVKMLTEFGS